jgi:hypothetical protein
MPSSHPSNASATAHSTHTQNVQRNFGIGTLGSNDTRSVTDAAELLNVSPATVKRATAIRKADPVLAEEIKQGKKKPRAAAAKTVAASSPALPTTPTPSPARAEKRFNDADEHFAKSVAALKDFARAYADLAPWARVISKIHGDLLKFGQLSETPTPFGLADHVKVLVERLDSTRCRTQCWSITHDEEKFDNPPFPGYRDKAPRFC